MQKAKKTALGVEMATTYSRLSSSNDDDAILFDGFAPGTVSGALSTPNSNESVTINPLETDENFLDKYDQGTFDPDNYESLVGKYQDFHTIDWLRELDRSRLRHRRIHETSGSRSFLKKSIDASSGWTSVLLIGLATGLFAGVINIVSESLADFKSGVCTKGLHLNRESCCWSSMHEEENCTDFVNWGELIFRVKPNSAFDHFVTFV